MKVNVVKNSPHRVGTNRDHIYQVVTVHNGCSYDEVVRAIDQLCRSNGYSNTAPKRHLDRLVNLGVVVLS